VIRPRVPNFYDLPQRRKRFRAFARAAGEQDRGKPRQNQTATLELVPPRGLTISVVGSREATFVVITGLKRTLADSL